MVAKYNPISKYFMEKQKYVVFIYTTYFLMTSGIFKILINNLLFSAFLGR